MRKFTGAAPFGAFLLLLLSTGCGQKSTPATAWLHVGDPQTIGGTPSQRNAGEYEQFRNTQVALIKSPLVLRAALDKPEIADLPLIKQSHVPQKWLGENLRIICPKDEELLLITLPGRDSQQSAKIVNAVKAAYLENIVQADFYNKLRARELVENAYKETMEEMKVKRALLSSLLQQPNQPESLNGVRDRMADFEREEMDLRSRRMDVDLQLAGAETRLAKSPADSAESAKAKLDLAVAEAQRKVLDHAEDELSQRRTHLKEQQSQHFSLLEQIKQLEYNAAQRSQELDRLKLELALPQRVISLQDASAF